MAQTMRSRSGAAPRKRLFRAATVAATGAIVALVAAGCAPSSSDEAAPESSTLVVALDTQPTSLDPAQAISQSAQVLPWQAAYDTLLRYNPDGSVSPNAAESFEFSEDATTLTLTLREGMEFTTGDPVDSAAVKASLEHFRDGGGPDSNWLAGVTVETPDESTVVVTAPEPRGLLPTFMSLQAGIIAEPDSLLSPDVATKPVGSGPYVLDEAKTSIGASYVYTRNEDYWNTEAYPYDTIEMQVITDATARFSALQSGQIDAAYIDATQASQAESAGLSLVRNQVLWWGLNIADRTGEVVPALGDVRVRQAMNMVFDRPAMLKALYQDQGVVSNQIFNPESAGFSEALLDRYPFDVEAAKKLMADAGYADGFDISIPNPGYAPANPLVIQQLGLLNIRVTEETVSPTEYLGEVQSGRWPVFYSALDSRTPLFVARTALKPESAWNVLHTQDPELDALLAEAEIAQGEDADKLFTEINDYVVEQAWFAPIVFTTDSWAFADGTTATALLGALAPHLDTFRPSGQ